MQLKAVEVCYDHLGLAMAIPIDVSFAELALIWLLLAFPKKKEPLAAKL